MTHSVNQVGHVYVHSFLRVLDPRQGTRAGRGESTCLLPMWLWCDSETQVWVEFVGFLLCTDRFFPGYSGFSFFSKTNT